MDKITIFDIDIEKDKLDLSEEKIELNDYEKADLILEEMYERAKVELTLNEMLEACRSHHNAQTIIKAYKEFGDDKGLEAICSSEEAWNMTDTLKKTLEKFKTFFGKIFEYVNNFVVLRISSASSTVGKWHDILNDKGINEERIKTMKKEYDVKDCTAEKVKIVLENALKAIPKISERLEQVKGLSTSSTSEKDTANLQEVTKLPEYETFYKSYEEFEKMIPEGDNKDSTSAVKAEEGKWFEEGSVGLIIKPMDNITVALKNLKRMQASCKTIIASLEKTSAGDGTDKQINDGKLKWLRDFSQNILSGMINKLTKVSSRAASKCQTLTNMYNKK